MTIRRLLSMAFLVSVLCGCESQTEPLPKSKAPRPVSVIRLGQSRPTHTQMMTGSVGAWKTEQIGFEVAGRVTRVLEPEEEIEGRILDSTGKSVLRPGTVLAELDRERYEIAVESAQATVDVAKRHVEAIQVDIEKRFPARIAAAEAEQRLATLESQRSSRLAESKAVSKSEWDRTRTTLETATASVASLQAELAAQEAELRSAEAQIKQAEQQLAEAQRDLRDTTLYSSFRGQVAQAHVVPGSYVTAGEPVLTVQMMDPIKVELELSAATSRRFRRGDTVRLFTVQGDDPPLPLEGFVYMTDPVADSETRTFTVTLLVRNQKTRIPIPAEFEGQSLARTKDIWPLNIDPIVGSGVALMVEETAVQRDAEGCFLWKVTNRHIDDVSMDQSRVLTVAKVRVTPGDLRIPFLGNWNFLPVTINAGEEIDPQRDLVAGGLTVGDGDPDQWHGDRILLDQSRWMLRPGDLVNVDTSNGNASSGYYVPMRAIRHRAGRTYVFATNEPDTDLTSARQVEVRLAAGCEIGGSDGVLRRIEPVNQADVLTDDTRLIDEGVHFISHGEPIAVVSESKEI